MLNFSLNTAEKRQLYSDETSLFKIYIFLSYSLQKFVAILKVYRKQHLLKIWVVLYIFYYVSCLLQSRLRVWRW
jgi:hypothetical protein